MKLYLIRHAAAQDPSQAPETERGLSESGRSRMMRVALGLRKLHIQPELILTSPLKRAVETATIIAQGLDDVRIETMKELSPGAELKSLIGKLRPHSKLSALALVGHQPDLGQLASFLLAGSPNACQVELKKGGVALLSGDLSEQPARFGLDWLLSPKILRRL